MRFTDFFIHHPTTTTLITAAIAGFGALCYFSLPVSNLPEVEYPQHLRERESPGRQSRCDGLNSRDAAREPVVRDSRAGQT